MKKKTGFMKVLSRRDFIVVSRYERLPMKPGQEQKWRELTVLDFTK